MTVMDIDKMTVAERLLPMESLWASLTKEYQETDIPLWHQQILDQRLDMLSHDETTILSLDELDARRK